MDFDDRNGQHDDNDDDYDEVEKFWMNMRNLRDDVSISKEELPERMKDVASENPQAFVKLVDDMISLYESKHAGGEFGAGAAGGGMPRPSSAREQQRWPGRSSGRHEALSKLAARAKYHRASHLQRQNGIPLEIDSDNISRCSRSVISIDRSLGSVEVVHFDEVIQQRGSLDIEDFECELPPPEVDINDDTSSVCKSIITFDPRMDAVEVYHNKETTDGRMDDDASLCRSLIAFDRDVDAVEICHYDNETNNNGNKSTNDDDNGSVMSNLSYASQVTDALRHLRQQISESRAGFATDLNEVINFVRQAEPSEGKKPKGKEIAGKDEIKNSPTLRNFKKETKTRSSLSGSKNNDSPVQVEKKALLLQMHQSRSRSPEPVRELRIKANVSSRDDVSLLSDHDNTELEKRTPSPGISKTRQSRLRRLFNAKKFSLMRPRRKSTIFSPIQTTSQTPQDEMMSTKKNKDTDTQPVNQQANDTDGNQKGSLEEPLAIEIAPYHSSSTRKRASEAENPSKFGASDDATKSEPSTSKQHFAVASIDTMDQKLVDANEEMEVQIKNDGPECGDNLRNEDDEEHVRPGTLSTPTYEACEENQDENKIIDVPEKALPSKQNVAESADEHIATPTAPFEQKADLNENGRETKKPRAVETETPQRSATCSPRRKHLQHSRNQPGSHRHGDSSLTRSHRHGHVRHNRDLTTPGSPRRSLRRRSPVRSPRRKKPLSETSISSISSRPSLGTDPITSYASSKGVKSRSPRKYAPKAIDEEGTISDGDEGHLLTVIDSDTDEGTISGGDNNDLFTILSKKEHSVGTASRLTNKRPALNINAGVSLAVRGSSEKDKESVDRFLGSWEPETNDSPSNSKPTLSRWFTKEFMEFKPSISIDRSDVMSADQSLIMSTDRSDVMSSFHSYSDGLSQEETVDENSYYTYSGTLGTNTMSGTLDGTLGTNSSSSSSSSSSDDDDDSFDESPASTFMDAFSSILSLRLNDKSQR